MAHPVQKAKHFMIRFLPWKFLVKHAARRYGVLDPATLLARLRGFAQPSEVAEPIELLRAGIVFHARGLVNAKAIQHNLDWVWPYWVQRQFSPSDPSFIPRAFSFSHINLTHRNWTSVGIPECAAYPIVDPRGLVTPLYDGWSIDFWIITENGRRLLPSRLVDEAVEQELILEPNLKVVTRSMREDLRLKVSTEMIRTDEGLAEVRCEVEAISDDDGWLVAAVRPYNPEGVQFIHRIEVDSSGAAFRVNDEATVELGERPFSLRMSHYADGDVHLDLPGSRDENEMTCKVGLATAAALFRVFGGTTRKLAVSISLEDQDRTSPTPAETSWKNALDGLACLNIGDSRMQFLYDAAVRTLVLLSADDLVPGPYTYRRFWFRDACLMLHPMMAIGMMPTAARVMAGFPARQNISGYFLSQEGEWDSNGQVLWIAAKSWELTGTAPTPEMDRSLRKAVAWLDRKRNREDAPQGTKGLLPAGFSAEHLGPNDYYYWDNYWAWAGLRAVARMWRQLGEDEQADTASALSMEFARCIGESISSVPDSRSKGGIPAAPGRRMDAGAVGSMVADYPLQLYPPGDKRIMATTHFLMDKCFHQGGFFQEMIHSGINAYLTLDLAQTLLRAGDPGYANLIRRVVDLASPTGQWPEAIHPHTHGGCMGDGQHGWAAAEWVMMIRNCFVREEDDHLVFGSGILDEWQNEGAEIQFGPTWTRWGKIHLSYFDSRLAIQAEWRTKPPRIIVAVPGHLEMEADSAQTIFHLTKS